jgi:hypothetical protein
MFAGSKSITTANAGAVAQVADGIIRAALLEAAG